MLANGTVRPKLAFSQLSLFPLDQIEQVIMFADSDLLIYMVHMRLHGARRKHKPLANIGPAVPSRQKAQRPPKNSAWPSL